MDACDWSKSGEEWAATPDTGFEENTYEEGGDTATARGEEEEEEVVKDDSLEVVSNEDEWPA